MAKQYLEHGLFIDQTIEIKAPLQTVWDELLQELGPRMKGEKGESMNMKLELWPGGRMYRDLGDNAGHLWGHVQVIKPPTLLEITGPLFMSFAAVNHLRFKLSDSAQDYSTQLNMIHSAVGQITPEFQEGCTEGWMEYLDNIRKAAEQH